MIISSKKLFTVLFAWLAVTQALQAQPTTRNSSRVETIIEDFNNNERKWDVKSYKAESYVIKDGHYYITTKKKSGYGFETKPFFINPKKPFIIETALQEVSGDNTNGAGLIWGYKSTKNYYRFVVTSNGQFNISKYKKGKFSHIAKWAKHEAIKTGYNVTNRLKMFSTSRGARFYINGKLVHTVSREEFKKHYFFGSRVGLIAYNNRVVKFDYLKIRRVKEDINLIANAKQGLKKENLGPNINSPFSDITPLISSDGNTLYFIRKDHPENIKRKKQDIWYATKEANGNWGKAKNLGRPVNNSAHNNIIAVSPDGNTLVVGGVYDAQGEYKKRGISIASRVASGWEVPKEINIKNYYNNSSFFGVCMSADRQKLVLALEREGGEGDLDLYVSFVQRDGTWSEPKSLGSRLNTFGGESAPFLAADDKTLYFSTNGLPGYGSKDIYVTRRLDDSWTRWSTPKNLGPDINSSDFDSGFKVTAQGDYAYLVSYTGKANKSDIFRIKLHESARPKPVVLVYGKVLNRKTGKPLGASIAYNDLNTGKLAGVARSNPKDGSYKIVLPYDKVYDFLASKSGFYSVSKHLDLSSVSKFKVIKRNLYLAPIIVGQKIRLNNLFFDVGKSALKSSSFAELNRLVSSMKSYPNMTIEVSGHTDAQGSPAKNLQLSKDRANAVLNYLKSKGIPTSRMQAKGYGQTKPLASNNTAQGRARNRRVEFMILKK
ncbi:OmpA family protein [uncultured Microscilla sp.]|uniref:OmpA family protein n=1 Tax=uncultured Microscilla sp. TaxID=432653 RepID=UPI0026194968|nr:OmpA family protein [uncultured Microscilla sp.]